MKIDSRRSIAFAVGSKKLTENARALFATGAKVPAGAINGFSTLVNFVPTASEPIHGWFRYREGFSTALVKSLLRGLPSDAIVVDPFCGSGTTLLASQELGYASVGFDVNPISVLVTRVKTKNYDNRTRTALRQVLAETRELSAASPQDEAPAFRIIHQVYQPKILNTLLVLRRFIKQLPSPVVRDFAFVAWLSILEAVSNVYKEGNGIKYRNRKRTPAGYINLDRAKWAAAHFPQDHFAFVVDAFVTKLTSMLDDVVSAPKRSGTCKIFDAPAESLASMLSPNSVDVAIFSPPYCNCFNYFKMYKLELWMGEFVCSYEDLRRLNSRALRSHVETALSRSGDTPIPEVEQYARLLDGEKLWSTRIPAAVRGYFSDMQVVLQQLFKVLRPGGKCAMVVGNSAYGGVVIPSDALLAQIAQRIGFTIKKLEVARHLTTSSQQRHLLGKRVVYLRESILVLEKRPFPKKRQS